jgi:hypothetical protein
MGRSLFKNDLLTGLEPPNRKSLEINETISRFMESPDFRILRRIGAMNPGEAGGLRLG